MLRLYDYLNSGNCYKVRLLLCLLGEPFERIPVNILKGETRTPEFLEKNPSHRVPLVEWPDGHRLAESNAILWYLAEGTRFLPGEAWERAQTLQWMFFEQYSHEPAIAVVRYWHHAGLIEQNRGALPGKMEQGYQALNILEDHLREREYLVGACYTIADIALYAYTHVAHEGGFDLRGYSAVNSWLERIRSHPGHVGITDEVGPPGSYSV
ncbi:glutathione S-transferase family protein [Thiohalorhabdus sp. Cl-TMA]|uniref:Glutathione S-transferase family protein n=1 Tax=Thiohalorhabdus methylotrophus TaxID=3242694 RepID=A0ABV4U1B0_9GAMM